MALLVRRRGWERLARRPPRARGDGRTEIPFVPAARRIQSTCVLAVFPWIGLDTGTPMNLTLRCPSMDHSMDG